ncbi:MAG: hypothetical protein LBR20_09120, partial [Propionibacteriaceae bacterium]|jgi:uncharacterized repeat protein (TIGR02543 family)|nr:hypothetical protein [Propionibacteriaceae bacterium]
VFSAWTTTKNGSTVVTAKSIVTSTADTITLYAKWQRLTKTITVSASGSGVKFSKLATVKVGKKGKLVIKSALKDSTKVDVTGAKFTVKKGSKTVAKNKATVTLGPGTYKVTTTASYKVASVKTVPAKTETTTTAKAGDVIDVKCSASWSTSFTGAGGAILSTVATDMTCTSDLLAAPLTWSSNSCLYGTTCDGGIRFTSAVSGGGFSGKAAKYTVPADIVKTVTTPATTETVWSATKTTTKTQSLKVK